MAGFQPRRNSTLEARLARIEQHLMRGGSVPANLADLLASGLGGASGGGQQVVIAPGSGGGGGGGTGGGGGGGGAVSLPIPESDVTFDASIGHAHDGSGSHKVTLAGDVTGDNTASVVAKIQGTAIPAPGGGNDQQFIQFNNGTSAFRYATPAAAGNAIGATAFGSEPGTPAAGDVDLYTNSYVLARWNGSAWIPWGPLFEFTPPINADYAWVNQGGASVATSNEGIYLVGPLGAGSDSLRCRVKAIPTAPYTVTMAFLPDLVFPADYNGCGMVLRNSVSGKLVTYGVHNDTGQDATDQVLLSIKWDSATSFNAFYTLTPALAAHLGPPAGPWRAGPVMWLRIQDDNTNRMLFTSNDGVNWRKLFSVIRTDFITPDQIGVFVNGYHGTYTAAINILSWLETTP